MFPFRKTAFKNVQHLFWRTSNQCSMFNQKQKPKRQYCRPDYRKIPKISHGACIFQRPFFEGLIFGGAYIRRGLSREGNLRFKIDWASLIVGSKFTVLALFYFVFEGNFLRTSPQGAYIWRGDLTERFLYYRFGGLIFGVAYFRNFTAP